jgi:hypothetical protein
VTASRRPDDAAQALEVVGGAWAQVLGVPSVDSDVEFPDFGADSTALMAVLGTLREQWPGLRVVDLFDHPTPAGLAAFVASMEA